MLIGGLSLAATLLIAGLGYLLISSGNDDDSESASTTTAPPDPETTTSSSTTTQSTTTTTEAEGAWNSLLAIQLAVEMTIGEGPEGEVTVQQAECIVEGMAADVSASRLDEVATAGSAFNDDEGGEYVWLFDEFTRGEAEFLLDSAAVCLDLEDLMEWQVADVLVGVTADMDEVDMTSSEAVCSAQGMLAGVDRYRMALFLYAPVNFEFSTSESQLLTGVIADCAG